MARLARSIIAGLPYHVVQRGHKDRLVFEAPADYQRYLEWLREYTARYGVDIWAYCLMPNHVHFICVPKAGDSLARAFNTLHMRYAQHFNAKRTENGRLWRARFMSCALDAASVREEVRFIENNPVRWSISARAEDYSWSSARSHASGRNDHDPVLSDNCFLTDEIIDWRDFLSGRGNEFVLSRTRSCLRTGRPAGDPEFVRKLEGIVGRRLEALPRGRPRKKAVP